MKSTLNEKKREIFNLACILNEDMDISTPISDVIFFGGMKISYFKKSQIYSVKTCEDSFPEISSRYILNLMCINLSQLCKTKKKNPQATTKRFRQKK